MDPIRLAFSSDFREEQSEAQRDELTQITQQQAERQDSASYEFSDPINALICENQPQCWAWGTEQGGRQSWRPCPYQTYCLLCNTHYTSIRSMATGKAWVAGAGMRDGVPQNCLTQLLHGTRPWLWLLGAVYLISFGTSFGCDNR